MYRKLAYARRLLKTSSILIVAETHCSVEEFVRRCKDICRLFVVGGSDALPGVDGRKVGGLLCFVSRSFAPTSGVRNGGTISCDEIVPSRVIRCSIDFSSSGGGQSVIWGVHHFGIKALGARQKSSIKSLALADVTAAKADPLTFSSTFIGD